MKVLLLSVVIIGALAPLAIEAQIKSVALMFRHGHRTPGATFPHFNSSAALLAQEIGFGELTSIGSRQLYDMGVDLRKRYLHLFPTSGYFRQSNMRILSSAYNRAITSLMSFMAGFFPPPANDKTIPFRWQSFPFSVDNLAHTLPVIAENCPAFVKDLEKPNAEFQIKFANNLAGDKVLLDRLSEYFGHPIDNFTSMLIACELIGPGIGTDPSQPKWVSDALDRLLEYVLAYYYEAGYTTELMKKVQGGNLMTKILDNLIAIRDGQGTALNFMLFSGHDHTVITAAKLLGVYSQLPVIMPDYGDTFAIEVIQVAKNGLEVQVVYVSESSKKKVILNVPNCGMSCPINKFIQNMQKYYVNDWNAICGL